MAIRNTVFRDGEAADRTQGVQTAGPSELSEPSLGPTREPILRQENVRGDAPSEISSPWQWEKLTSLESGNGTLISLPNALSVN